MTNSLFEEFRAHACGYDKQLHADLTLYSLLSFLPETTIIQVHSLALASSLQINYSTSSGHGALVLNQASPELKLELKRWIDKRETKRALGLGAKPPSDEL